MRELLDFKFASRDFKDAKDADTRLPFVCARIRAHPFCLEAHGFEEWRPLKRRKPPRCETWAAFTGKTSENRLGDALQIRWIAPRLAHAGQGFFGYELKHSERVVLHRELALVKPFLVFGGAAVLFVRWGPGPTGPPRTSTEGPARKRARGCASCAH